MHAKIVGFFSKTYLFFAKPFVKTNTTFVRSTTFSFSRVPFLLQSGQLYIEFFFRVAINQTLMHCVSLLLTKYFRNKFFDCLIRKTSPFKLSPQIISEMNKTSQEQCKPKIAFQSINQGFLAVCSACSEHSVVRKLPNLAYVFQSLCWCMRRGPMKTGGVFVLLLSNFRFRYVVTVKLMFSSNMLKVGSTPKMQKSFGLVQNRLRSSSCRLVARMTRKSGWTLHFLMKVASLDISSSRFAFSTRA